MQKKLRKEESLSLIKELEQSKVIVPGLKSSTGLGHRSNVAFRAGIRPNSPTSASITSDPSDRSSDHSGDRSDDRSGGRSSNSKCELFVDE